jgi:hypothetical protein
MADTDEIDTVSPPGGIEHRGQTTLMTKLLIVFNLLAVLAFGALLYTDLTKRQDWAKAVFLRELALAGLPLDDVQSKLGTSPDAGTQPKYDLDPPLIKDAYKARGGKLTDKFMAVREGINTQIHPSDLDQDILTKHFDGGAGTPVMTLSSEIQTLKTKMPSEIDKVAQSVAAKAKDKSAQEKQELLRRILFPLCTEGWQVELLEQKIVVERTPKQDEDFLAAAVKRRLWFDILQPAEVFRPSDKANPTELEKAHTEVKKLLVDRAAELDQVSLEDLRKLFAKRCDDALADQHWLDKSIKRDNREKRRFAAFLLADVSQVVIPGTEPVEPKQPAPKAAKEVQKKEPEKKAEDEAKEEQKAPDQPEPKAETQQKRQRQLAFPNAERRAEVVCGLYDFDQACEDLSVVTDILARQTVEAIHRDLGAYRYPIGDGSAIGFLGKYELALQRVQELKRLVDRREQQYLEVKATNDERAKQLDNRTTQEKATVDQLLEARDKTRQLQLDLKTLQDQLFLAQLELRGAHEYVQYLVQRLGAAERQQSKAKGGADR